MDAHGLQRMECFLSLFPYAYHVSLCPNPRTIRSVGLLSAAGLLDQCELPTSVRDRLLNAQRRTTELLGTQFGPALLNDQIPLPAKALEKCLLGMSPPECYVELSERTFFFLSEKKKSASIRASACQ